LITFDVPSSPSSAEKHQYTIEIMDNLGKLIRTMPIDVINANSSIDISDLPSGVYYLKCYNKSDVLLSKVVKQ